jgi:hypothetical protein
MHSYPFDPNDLDGAICRDLYKQWILIFIDQCPIDAFLPLSLYEVASAILFGNSPPVGVHFHTSVTADAFPSVE